jgi:2-amino-4-hydroxy-6-hydroxymethyldihydropteridine diphosphokinase
MGQGPERSVVLGLGSNLGSREALLRAAVTRIEVLTQEPARPSGLYRTLPVGPAQGVYLNAAVALHTALPSRELLALAQEVEAGFGRVRGGGRWGPRTLDVDLLWCEGEALETPSLTVPHPRLRGRAFALEPLLELVPDARDPTDGAPYARVQRDTAGVLERSPWREAFPTEALLHTADEGFVTHATDRADLLAAAAEALGALIVEPEGVRPASRVGLSVALDPDTEDDERLFRWLAEVLHALDAGRFALRRAVVLEDGASGVRGVLLGEALDEARHPVRGAVKAVTLHGLAALPTPEGLWRAQVIMDV